MSPGLVLALTLGLAPSAGERSWRPAELKVAPPPALKRWSEVFKRAERYLGRPYEMGGVGSPAFDCSGFVCRVYAESGYALPRVSRDQAQAGLRVPLDALRPGDLLFFADRGRPVSHVGIYLGEDELIHASSGEGEVVIASLRARWFQDHLVGARRVLSSTVAGGYVYRAPPVRELREHAGAFSLPITLRRPPERPPPGLGPARLEPRQTAARVEGAWATEDGKGAMVWVPRLSLQVREWALFLEAGLPVRFEPKATVGRLNSAAELSRLLRHLQLGLPNADLYLRLSRGGDLSLGRGLLLTHLIPASAAAGLPSYSVQRGPLSAAAQLRMGGVQVGLVADDLIAPKLAGAALGVARRGFGLAAELAADWGRLPGEGRRADASGTGLELSYALVQSRRWTARLAARGVRLRSDHKTGFGAEGRLLLQRRLGGTRAVSVEAFGGALGPAYLAQLFGPSYAAHRAAQLAALPGLRGRTEAGGRLSLELGRVLVSVQGAAGIGQHAAPLDNRGAVVLQLRRLRGLLAVPLDLRFAYAARGLFAGGSGRVQSVLQTGLRLPVKRWMSVEAQLMRGEATEAAIGLTLSWADLARPPPPDRRPPGGRSEALWRLGGPRAAARPEVARAGGAGRRPGGLRPQVWAAARPEVARAGGAGRWSGGAAAHAGLGGGAAAAAAAEV